MKHFRNLDEIFSEIKTEKNHQEIDRTKNVLNSQQTVTERGRTTFHKTHPQICVDTSKFWCSLWKGFLKRAGQERGREKSESNCRQLRHKDIFAWWILYICAELHAAHCVIIWQYDRTKPIRNLCAPCVRTYWEFLRIWDRASVRHPNLDDLWRTRARNVFTKCWSWLFLLLLNCFRLRDRLGLFPWNSHITLTR